MEPVNNQTSVAHTTKWIQREIARFTDLDHTRMLGGEGGLTKGGATEESAVRQLCWAHNLF